MTTALLCALLIPTAIFLLGLLLGVIVRFSPGVEWKVRLGKRLARVQAWAEGQDEDGRQLAALEMEWSLRRVYCKDLWQAPLYDEILTRSQKGTAHHVDADAVHRMLGK